MNAELSQGIQDTIFKLFERFSDELLEVSEVMEMNGKRTFGYDQPILYRRAQ